MTDESAKGRARNLEFEPGRQLDQPLQPARRRRARPPPWRTGEQHLAAGRQNGEVMRREANGAFRLFQPQLSRIGRENQGSAARPAGQLPSFSPPRTTRSKSAVALPADPEWQSRMAAKGGPHGALIGKCAGTARIGAGLDGGIPWRLPTNARNSPRRRRASPAQSRRSALRRLKRLGGLTWVTIDVRDSAVLPTSFQWRQRPVTFAHQPVKAWHSAFVCCRAHLPGHG